MSNEAVRTRLTDLRSECANSSCPPPGSIHFIPNIECSPLMVSLSSLSAGFGMMQTDCCETPFELQTTTWALTFESLHAPVSAMHHNDMLPRTYSLQSVFLKHLGSGWEGASGVDQIKASSE